MRTTVLILCLAAGLAASCGGKKSTPDPGDSSVTPGDPAVATRPPPHVKVTSGSGEASSPSFRARLRIGPPLPSGRAGGFGKQITGGSNESL